MQRAKSEIKFLEKQIKKLENAAGKIIFSNSKLDEQFKLLTEIKGVGEKLALAIIADMPDIKNFEKAGQFAAFAGVPPPLISNRGPSVNGKSHLSKIGSKSTRKVLYMNVLVVKNHNLHFQKFAQKLQKKARLQRSLSVQ